MTHRILLVEDDVPLAEIERHLLVGQVPKGIIECN